MTEYQIKPIGKVCAATGKELAPGSGCHSVLVEKNGELLRFDFSEDGWSEPPHGAIAHWHCVVPEAAKSVKKALDPDELMRQFEQLCEEASPATEKFRYVLALLLLRRRRLKHDGTKVIEEQEYLELSGLRGEGTFFVQDQQLDDAEIEQMQQQIFGESPAPASVQEPQDDPVND